MRIFVQAKTGSKKTGVSSTDDTHFVVSVSARPVDGEANEAIREELAKYFGISRARVSLVSGASSRKKVFEVD